MNFPGSPPDPSQPRPLDAAQLQENVASAGDLWTRIEVLDSVESTNAHVAAACRDGASEGLVVAAEHQTHGRGRLDRRWEAPAGSSVVVSVALAPTTVPVERWPWLPLLAGLAVDLTVRDCGVRSSVKWPNDVLVGGAKICGILVERVEAPRGPMAVVGIGLNVSMGIEDLPVATATSLALENADTTDRTVVLELLLGHLERLYLRWRAADGHSGVVRSDYLRQCVTVGSAVRVQMPDGSVLEGTADDVDEQGRLVVDGRALSAGDVTHVRPAGG